ncbi:hypothetical protein GCM10009853_072740 [Glycomyces scopariae]
MHGACALAPDSFQAAETRRQQTGHRLGDWIRRRRITALVPISCALAAAENIEPDAGQQVLNAMAAALSVTARDTDLLAAVELTVLAAVACWGLGWPGEATAGATTPSPTRGTAATSTAPRTDKTSQERPWTTRPRPFESSTPTSTTARCVSATAGSP